jgi:GT2 family glycosyltransferase
MRVAIVVLNWNNPTVTIACLESLRALRYRGLTVYVLDNGSTDDSRPRLQNWLASTAGAKGGRYRQCSEDADHAAAIGADHGDFVYVQIGRNRGYAGGNNVGIRLALAEGCDAVWILNNDTTVAEDSLDRLVAFVRTRRPFSAAGVCILEQDRPSRVQCVGGGKYSWPLSRHSLLGSGLDVSVLPDRLMPPPDYIAGSSMFVPRSTFEAVGLFDEAFFLYCEEIDFAERCRVHGLAPIVCTEAKVWHAFGSTSGTSRRLAEKSELGAFYGTRSALLVTAKHRPFFVPLVLAVRFVYAASLLVRGHLRLSRAVGAGLLSAILRKEFALGR